MTAPSTFNSIYCLEFVFVHLHTECTSSYNSRPFQNRFSSVAFVWRVFFIDFGIVRIETVTFFCSATYLYTHCFVSMQFSASCSAALNQTTLEIKYSSVLCVCSSVRTLQLIQLFV